MGEAVAVPARRGAALLPVAVLCGAMLLFTGGSSLAKQLFPVVGAEGTAALRLCGAALTLSALLRPWRARAPGRAWGAVVLYGLALGSMNLCFYLAINRIPLGLAIAIEFTGPLAVALASSRRVLDSAWIGLAATGLLLLLPVRDPVSRLDPWGIVAALAAGGFWAVYMLAGKRAGQAFGAVATPIGMALGALLVLPIGLAEAGDRLFAPNVLGAGLLLALVSSALPYTLEMYALRRLPAQVYGTLTSLEPALGALMGFLVLGERLAARELLAIALIVAASIGVTLGAMRASAREAKGRASVEQRGPGFEPPL